MNEDDGRMMLGGTANGNKADFNRINDNSNDNNDDLMMMIQMMMTTTTTTAAQNRTKIC